MRRPIISLFLIISTLFSCVKEEEAVVTYEYNDDLNTTEQKLSGRWYLKSKTDSIYYLHTQLLDNNQTKSYTNFNNQNYIDFTSKLNSVAKDNPQDFPDAKSVYLSTRTVSIGQIGEPVNQVYFTTYWYFNENTNDLIIYDDKYKIKLLDENHLVIIFDTDKYTNSTITSFFER